MVGSGHVDDTRDTEALGANPTTGGMIGRAQQAAGCSRSRHQRRAAKSATLRRHIAGEANSACTACPSWKVQIAPTIAYDRRKPLRFARQTVG